MSKLRQADLALSVGISASYLNLIEHNRRRIGGKLLMDIAHALGVEPALLTEGAEASVIAQLQEAVGMFPEIGEPSQSATDLVTRFPEWARVITAAHGRIATLERRLEAVSDRLSHDPHLATALHDVLSTVTAIRSTAAILSETKELEPEWRDRFHRNINEDAKRLADGSQALVSYLDNAEDAGGGISTPDDEVDQFLSSHNFHFPTLESDEQSIAEVINHSGVAISPSAIARLADVLAQYRDDCRLLPSRALGDAISQFGLEPLAIAEALAVPLPTVLRRLALSDLGKVSTEIGLVIVDAAGALILRKPVSHFLFPRFGAGCALWPVFQSFGVPQIPIRMRVQQTGSSDQACWTISATERIEPMQYNRPAAHRAIMLVLPPEDETEGRPPINMGIACRVCALRDCLARREPSILADGF